MFGYWNECYEFFGKFLVRFDDVLNFIFVWLIVFFYFFFGGRKVFEYYRLVRFKINFDKLMVVMSVVFGVWFEKFGVYCFLGKELKNEDIK